MVHKTVGCTTCKKRKLKCDLSLPGCQRCRRIGKECPGYPTEWDLAFRSENEVVRAKARKKRDSVSNYTKRKLSPASSRSPSPQLGLSDDIQLHAISLFFHDYIVHSCQGICEGWLDYLPDLYLEHTESSILRHAVLAAAYANIAQRTTRKDLELKAASFYHTSLERVKNNLSDTQLATSDVNMTAVVLLGIYECVNNPTFFECSFQHTKGLSVLADLRGSLLRYGQGPTLLQIACCQVNRRNIEFGLHPSAAHQRLNNLLDSTSAASRMVMNMFNVSVFSANTFCDIRSGNLDRLWNISILQSFKDLENDNRRWVEDAGIAFPYRIVPCTPGDHVHSEFTSETEHHIYRGFWSEALWNKHRGAVITLNQALLARLDAVKSSHPDNDSETPDVMALRHKAKITIQTMIRDIFASVPFSLGDVPSHITAGLPKSVAGYFLVWTLKVILRCPFASEEEQHLARAALLRIGRQFGISYAVKSAQDYTMRSKNASPADSKTNISHDDFIPDVLA